MTAFETTRAMGSTPAGRLSQIFVAAFSAVAAWNDARITRHALSKLSARELEDIGLCFGDIDTIANRTIR
jgi:uncharacterized protein YjiS (DUF1127 family)